MRCSLRCAVLAAALAVGGCSSLPRERGYAETGAWVASRLGLAPTWSPHATNAEPLSAELPTEPLSPEQAVRLAFLHNPRLREEYARLGLGRAELEAARRLSNPRVGYSLRRPRAGIGSQITRSVSLGFTDLLLWPARKRLAAGELERLQQSVAAALLKLATDVEAAWFKSVSATQVAAMRELVAQAAGNSSRLAQRFFDAGNIGRLQLEQERAAASQARIAAVRAQSAALRARSRLATLMGVPMEAGWTTPIQLPAPPRTAFSAVALVPLALTNRLDLAAAAQRVRLREAALGVARRWRWLGEVELDYERETEPDGEVLRGPALALALPLFDQGQAGIARADAELLDARARLEALAVRVRNEARLGTERLNVAREIVERYRNALVPRREAVVRHTQEQVNFMLLGVFELLLAKREEYDAYQEYLEAVRDYWVARAELKRIVGGRLPDDDAAAQQPTIGIEAVLPSERAPPLEHAMHGAPGDTHRGAATAADPPAGHADHATTPGTDAASHAHSTGGQSRSAAPAAPAAQHHDAQQSAPKRAQHDHGDSP